MKKICFVLLLIAFAMFSTENLLAQSSGWKINEILKTIYPDDQPGAAVLVIQNGKRIINNGFGLRNFEKEEKVTPDSHFRMASVSKQFTAMCILLLDKQGKLSVNDPLTKWLKGLPSFMDGITLNQLMTHTSGIADYELLIPDDQKEQVSDADVLSLIKKSDSLYFQPGTKFRYSNTGFCLLTQVVEKVSGLPYSQFIIKNIFSTTGMDHTVMYQKEAPIIERAFGYQKKDGKWKFGDQSITSATMGDGSVYTSTTEYQKWIKALWNQKLLNENPALNPMMPHTHITEGIDYGYGWFIAKESDGTTACFHSGESKGFHNIVYHNPSKKTLVVIFSNSDDKRVSKAFEQIQSLLKIKIPAVAAGRSLFDFLSNLYSD